jgi:hypothetical protein
MDDRQIRDHVKAMLNMMTRDDVDDWDIDYYDNEKNIRVEYETPMAVFRIDISIPCEEDW